MTCEKGLSPLMSLQSAVTNVHLGVPAVKGTKWPDPKSQLEMAVGPRWNLLLAPLTASTRSAALILPLGRF